MIRVEILCQCSHFIGYIHRIRYNLSISLYYPFIHTIIYPFKEILGPATMATASSSLFSDAVFIVYVILAFYMYGREVGGGVAAD